MTYTYHLAKREPNDWWLIVDTLEVKIDNDRPVRPVDVARAHWPQAVDSDNFRILLQVRPE